MPPSLSVSVGVPATVTAQLRFSVNVTTLPALRSRLGGDSTIELSVGPDAGGAICKPENVTSALDRLAVWPLPVIVAPFGKLTCVIDSAETAVSLAPTV